MFMTSLRYSEINIKARNNWHFTPTTIGHAQMYSQLKLSIFISFIYSLALVSKAKLQGFIKIKT